MLDLGVLPGHDTSEALAINERRQVIGDSFLYADQDHTWRAFVWQGGVMTEIRPLPGFDLSLPKNVNKRGQVTFNSLNRFGPFSGRGAVLDLRALRPF